MTKEEFEHNLHLTLGREDAIKLLKLAISKSGMPEHEVPIRIGPIVYLRIEDELDKAFKDHTFLVCHTMTNPDSNDYPMVTFILKAETQSGIIPLSNIRKTFNSLGIKYDEDIPYGTKPLDCCMRVNVITTTKTVGPTGKDTIPNDLYLTMPTTWIGQKNLELAAIFAGLEGTWEFNMANKFQSSQQPSKQTTQIDPDVIDTHRGLDTTNNKLKASTYVSNFIVSATCASVYVMILKSIPVSNNEYYSEELHAIKKILPLMLSKIIRGSWIEITSKFNEPKSGGLDHIPEYFINYVRYDHPDSYYGSGDNPPGVTKNEMMEFAKKLSRIPGSDRLCNTYSYWDKWGYETKGYNIMHHIKELMCEIGRDKPTDDMIARFIHLVEESNAESDIHEGIIQIMDIRDLTTKLTEQTKERVKSARTPYSRPYGMPPPKSFSKQIGDLFTQPSSSSSSSGTSSSSSGGCFIATVVYGSYDAYEVLVLRQWRDRGLSSIQIGERFIRLYYKISPSIASWIKDRSLIRILTKKLLDVFIHIWLRNYR